MDRKLTLVEHLGELRKGVILSLVTLGIASIVSLPLANNILKILKFPASGLIKKLVFFSPQEAFLIYMRVAFLCGWIISMPMILYQGWLFISPAVDEKYKRHISYFIVLCVVAFITGIFFAYFILLPPALKFLLNFAGDELEPVLSANKYISFVTGLLFGCGLVFQMPVLSAILTKLGIINARILREKYKYAIIAILVVSAIITPTPDVFNMMLLAMPMILLYEVSIWISKLITKRRTL